MEQSKVKIESLELSISYHCNLNCKGCSHCSPIFEEEYFDIDKEIKVLKILKKYLDIKIVKLIGGEPLLNRDIDKIIRILKKELIGQKIYVATNGLLLSQMSDFFWNNIDGLEVSIYRPGFENFVKKIIVDNFIRDDQEAYIYCYNKFRHPFVKRKICDKKLVRHIYKNCLFARDWQCFNYNKGYFFKCPQSWVLSQKFKLFNFDDVGIKVEDKKNFSKTLYDYIQSEEPIKACNYCLGCVGKLFQIKQLDRKNYINTVPEKFDNLIDAQFLEELDINRDVLIGTIHRTIKIRGVSHDSCNCKKAITKREDREIESLIIN